MGILIEQYGGAMPVWLSPEQARVMAISDKTNAYAQAVQKRLSDAGLRCEADLSDEKIGAKIARAHAEKAPYMLVVGPKEAESNSVNVRFRASNQTRTMPVEEFLAAARQKIDNKDTDVAF